MELKEIINLSKTKESITIIKSFLQNALPLEDYTEAFLTLQNIYFELKDYDNLIEESITYFKDFDTWRSFSKCLIIENMIKTYLNLNKNDLAFKYLEMLKLETDEESEYLSVYWEIEINKNNGYDIKKLLEKAINITSPKYIKEEFLKSLLNIYLKENDFKKALEYLLKLKELTNFQYPEESLKIYYFLEDYDKLLNLISLLKNDQNNSFITNFYLMLYEMKQNNYRKASVYEAETKSYLNQASLDLLKNFYEKCYELYYRLNNNYLKNYYLNQIEKLKKHIPKELEQKEMLDENILFKKDDVKKQTNIFLTSNTYLKSFKALINLLEFSNQIESNFSLNDYLRTIFIYLNEFYKSKYHIIYLQNKNYYIFYNEKLYEYNNLELNVNSTINLSYDLNYRKIFKKDEFLNLSFMHNQKEIEDDINGILSFPLGDFGTYQVLQESKEQAEEEILIYDLLSKIIYAKIKSDLKIKNLKDNETFLKEIFLKNQIPMRYLSKQKTIYNNNAKKLLNINDDYFLEVFLKKIRANNLFDYKNKINYLFDNPGTELEYEYEYESKTIKESMKSFNFLDNTILISTFENTTYEKDLMLSLKQKAEYDQIFNVYNLDSLLKQFDSLINGKKTFINLELNMKNKVLYSEDINLNYVKEFIKIVEDNFKDIKIYLLSSNEFFMVLNYNDIRTVKKVLDDFLLFLKNYIPESNKYEKYKVYISYLRYPISSDSTNFNRILKSLRITKELTKKGEFANCLEFMHSHYEENIFEEKIIDYLNEALEKENLQLKLTPLVNLEKNKTSSYEASLGLNNVILDSNYLLKLSIKRGHEKMYYEILFQKAFLFLKALEKEFHEYLHLVIPINYKILFSYNFIEYFKNLSDSLNIPLDFIKIKIIGELPTNLYLDKIKYLKDLSIEIITDNINNLLNYDVNYFELNINNLDSKKENFYQKIDEYLILNNIGLMITGIKKESELIYFKDKKVSSVKSNLFKDTDEVNLIKSLKE